jgi:hypothetical protein
MAKITYDNKVSLNPQPSIANINKVSDADMNEIKTCVNDNCTYSTNEICIGEWINGKPIYRKVIEGTTASSNVPTAIGSISNLGIIVNIRGYILNPSQNQAIPINFVYNTEQNAGYREGNNIIVRTTASVYQSKSCYVIVEYTKTTD